MNNELVAIEARWVATVDESNAVYEDYTLVIDGNAIKHILPTDVARKRYASAIKVLLPTHALIPGFVNTHTHAAMSLLRGLADDHPLQVWLHDHIWPAESKWASSQFVADGTRLAFAEMIKSGTTCMNDMYFFPETVATVAEEVSMRACVGLIAIEFPTAWASEPDEYLKKGKAVHQDAQSMNLVSTMMAPHAPYTVADETFRKIATLADELDIGMHIHVHETAEEIESSLDQHGRRPIDRLDELGLINSRLLAVHATQLADREIELLASKGAKISHCPKSNMKLASGLCRVNDLIAAGITVGVGTDGAASNNTLDMLEEMRFAALLAKAVSSDATAVTAAQALRMATIDAAKCIGLDAKIGSLQKGKLADIAAIDLNSARTEPVYDPVRQIVYSASSNQITDVWINGKRVMRTRKLTTINESKCNEAANQWAHRIRTETPSAAPA